MSLASAVAEPLHRQLFGLIEGMIRQGRKADVRTLKSSTSQVISPNGLTAGEYIARCAAEAVSLRPEDVGRYLVGGHVCCWPFADLDSLTASQLRQQAPRLTMTATTVVRTAAVASS